MQVEVGPCGLLAGGNVRARPYTWDVIVIKKMWGYPKAGPWYGGYGLSVFFKQWEESQTKVLAQQHNPDPSFNKKRKLEMSCCLKLALFCEFY